MSYPIMTFKKTVCFLSLFLVGFTLIACSTPRHVPGIIEDVQHDINTSYYYQNRNKIDAYIENQLHAIRALILTEKSIQAEQKLQTLPKELSASQQWEKQLLLAELTALEKNYQATTVILNNLPIQQLTPRQQTRYYHAEIIAKQHQPLALIRAYIARAALHIEDGSQDNSDEIWKILLRFTPQRLDRLVIYSDEYELQGWFDLLYAYHENQEKRHLLQTAIKEWQTRYAQHPAARKLPLSLSQTLLGAQVTKQLGGQITKQKIALFLPLSGPKKRLGEAIELGFRAAKAQEEKRASHKATIESNHKSINLEKETQPWQITDFTADVSDTRDVKITSDVQITSYDTNKYAITDLLSQAQQAGTTWVVGPLLKSAVEELATLPTKLNILALNQLDAYPNRPNICYFALSPQDESRAAAAYLWQQQKRRPLLLIPQGEFGNQIKQAFTAAWQKLGGDTVLQKEFASLDNLKHSINRGRGMPLSGRPVLLNVAPQTPMVPGSINTIAYTSHNTQNLANATSSNIDAVYISATANELTLIKTMIDMASTSQNRPKLFTSSRSHRASAGPDYRLEMEGIHFSDIPLIAGSNPQLLQQAQEKYTNDYSLIRLYAMGADAWLLTQRFMNGIEEGSMQSLKGVTGELSISSHCIINRENLSWLQYKQGVVVPAI